MKNRAIYRVAAVLCAVMAFTGCAKEVIDETTTDETPKGESSLNVLTRAAGDTGTDYVAYPVRVYAFNSDNTCVATQTLTDANDVLSMTLNNGTYNIYAIGGAQDDRYQWPTQSAAVPTTPLTLATGKTLDDLQAGHNTVTLNNEAATLTLALERKVMMLQGVTIQNVPATVTAVSVSLQPLYESMLLNGTHNGEAGSSTVTLTKQADGTTWQFTSTSSYLYPSVGNPSITVRFTTDATTKSYTYTSAEAMPANHKVSITGTYTGGGVTLSGTLTAQDWGEDKVINFNFNETNSNTTPPSTIPQPGDLYLSKYYVLATNGNVITVLSDKDEDEIISTTTNDENDATLTASIQTKLASWDNSISATWRLMTEDEISNAIDNRVDITTKSRLTIYNGNYNRYYFTKDSGISMMYVTSKTIKKGGDSVAHLRPVADIDLSE